MSASFEPGSLVGKSFDLFKENVGPLLGGLLLVIVISAVANMLSFGIATVIISGPLYFGLFKICLEITRGKPVEISLLFSGFSAFLPAFLTFLLVGIFAFIGTFFCLIPGIFVAIIYMPVYFFLIDGEENFWEAMEKSRAMVMNNLGPWVVLFLIMLALNIVGALACGVGVLVTGPMSCLMIALAYEAERGGATVQAQAAE